MASISKVVAANRRWYLFRVVVQLRADLGLLDWGRLGSAIKADHIRRPAAGGRRSAVGGRRATVGGRRRSAVGGRRRSAAGGGRLTGGGPILFGNLSHVDRWKPLAVCHLAGSVRPPPKLMRTSKVMTNSTGLQRS